MMLQTLQVLIKKKPRPGHRLLVLATTSSEDDLEPLDLLQGFNVQVDVPWLNPQETLATMSQLGVATDVLAQVDSDAMIRSIGIKKLLLIVAMADARGGVTKESF